MLAKLLENSIEKIWSYDEFFRESANIKTHLFISLINIKDFDIFKVALKPNET
jgi:hypothetical protein